MAFITTIPVDEATGEVRAIYERDQRRMGYVPNYTKLYSHRPQVYGAWGNLISAIRANMGLRRYELATLAAARALCSSYCVLAHGSVLLGDQMDPAQLGTMVEDYEQAGLTAAEVAVMAFAEKIANNATSVTQEDVQRLRDHGLSDAEIFDVAATAAARCFFSKLLDALGAEADSAYLALDETLRRRLTVGRDISTAEPERLAETPAAP